MELTWNINMQSIITLNMGEAADSIWMICMQNIGYTFYKHNIKEFVRKIELWLKCKGKKYR